MSEANGNPTASDRQAAAPGRRQLPLVFAGLLLAVLLAALDQTIVATALPTIVASCTVWSTCRGWSPPTCCLRRSG